MKRKSLLVLSMLLLGGSLLSACGGNNNASQEPGNTQASPEATATEGSTGNSYLASEKALNLDIFYFDNTGTVKMDAPVLKKAAELTNISLNNVASAGGEEKQAYNLMLASGTIPDIISYYTADLNTIGDQGALAP